MHIPSSVDYVDENEFNQSGLMSVEIPKDSITKFEEHVFSNCKMLANIALPPSSSQDEIVDVCRDLNDVYGSTK